MNGAGPEGLFAWLVLVPIVLGVLDAIEAANDIRENPKDPMTYVWILAGTIDPTPGNLFKRGGKHVAKEVVKTARKKSTKQLRKEWEEITGDVWPNDPTRPGKKKIAHHETALADGGRDHGSNIKPMEYREHIDHHINNGDYSRWAKETWKRRRNIQE